MISSDGPAPLISTADYPPPKGGILARQSCFASQVQSVEVPRVVAPVYAAPDSLLFFAICELPERC